MSITQKEEKPKTKLKLNGESFSIAEGNGKPASGSNGTTEQAPPERKPLRMLKKGNDFKPETSVSEPKPASQTNLASSVTFTPTIPYTPQSNFGFQPQNFMSTANPNFYPFNAYQSFQPNIYNGQAATLPQPLSTLQTQLSPQTPINFSEMNDPSTKELAQKLKLRTQQKEALRKEEEKTEASLIEKSPAVQPVPEPEKVVETKTVLKQEEKIVKKETEEENEQLEDGGVAGGEDSDDLSEEDSDEDFSNYPQERPKKIIYTRKMILEFIEKEKTKKTVLTSDQLEDLLRDISIVNKTKDLSNYGKKSSYTGERERRKYNDKGGDYKYRNSGGGGRPSGGSKYKQNPYEAVESKPSPATFVRPVMTEEEKEKIAKIRESGDLLNKVVDKETKMKKEVNLILFKITQENKDLILNEIKPFCTTYDSCQMVVSCLIDKAWSQAKYTKIYADLCSELGAINANLLEGLSEEKVAEIREKNKDEVEYQKLYKNFVITKIRKEFMQGFETYKKIMKGAEENDKFSNEDKLVVYQKAKGKLLSNMTFISELYKKKYLPHKVMRFITYSVINQYADESCKIKPENTLFSTNEVFLEAFFQIMETCGEELESKEHKMSLSRDTKSTEASAKKTEGYISYMVKSLGKKNYTQEESNNVLTEADKKEINFISLTFKLIKAINDNGLASTRLSSLMENAIEGRSNKWKNYSEESPPKRVSDLQKDIDSKKSKPAARTGGTRREDDYYTDKRETYKSSNKRGSEYEEYVVKDKKPTSTQQPTEEYKVKQQEVAPAPAVLNTGNEIKAIFDLNKTTDDLEVYDDLFKPDNPALKGAKPEEIFSLFLEHFMNTDRKIAEVRTVVASQIVKNFGLSEEVFFKVLAGYLSTGYTQDIPVIKKAMGKIIAHSMTKSNFTIHKLNLIFSSNDDDREEQKWFYDDVIEQALNELTSTKAETNHVEELTKFKQSLK